MSGKSIKYWQQRWDAVKKSPFPEQTMRMGHTKEEDDAIKTLVLLSQYSCFFKFPLWPVGGSIGRFFSGRWNTHHGDAIQKAIAGFYTLETFGDLSCIGKEECYSVNYILALVKKEIGDNQIKPGGDLNNILQVIKEKTDFDYYSRSTLSPEDIIKLHEDAYESKFITIRLGPNRSS